MTQSQTYADYTRAGWLLVGSWPLTDAVGVSYATDEGPNILALGASVGTFGVAATPVPWQAGTSYHPAGTLTLAISAPMAVAGAFGFRVWAKIDTLLTGFALSGLAETMVPDGSAGWRLEGYGNGVNSFWNFACVDGGGTVRNATAPAGSMTTGWQMVEWGYDGTNDYIQVNGGTRVTTAVTGYTQVPAGATNFEVGTIYDGNYNWPGQLAHAAWFAANRSSAESLADYKFALGTGALFAYLLATPSTGGVTITGTSVGGTAPRTDQIHRSTLANFTPAAGTLLAAGDGPYVDADAIPARLYFYKLKSTDSAGSPATFSTVGVPACTTGPALTLCIIGDSIGIIPRATSFDGVYGTIWDYVLRHLQRLYSSRTIVLSNQSAAGTATTDWAVGGSRWNAAMAAFAAAAAPADSIVVLKLGANDSRIGTSFLANTLAQIVALKALGYARIVVSYPNYIQVGHLYQPFVAGWTEATAAVLQGYLAGLDSLADGRTVFINTRPYIATSQRPDWTTDGVHPNDIGVIGMASEEAMGVIDAIEAPPFGRATVQELLRSALDDQGLTAENVAQLSQAVNDNETIVESAEVIEVR